MQNKTSRRFLGSIIIVLILLVALAVRLRQTAWNPYDSGRWLALGTYAQVQVRCREERLALQTFKDAKAAINRVNALMNPYSDDSELARINAQAGTGPVQISAETYHILERAKYYSELTDGAFDITVGPLSAAWKQAAKENRWPDEQELAEAAARVGYEKITLTEQDGKHMVALAVPGMRLDVSAIAKGYAVDCALAAVRRKGIMSALVDIGGEIACFGPERPGKYWRIGVQDPFVDETEGLRERSGWIITLQDQCVATSGNYRRYVTIDGQHHSHIIDPRTRQPADKLPSVTVIAPTAMDADALATAISVMGAEAGLQLIETIPDTEAFLVTGGKDDPQTAASTGMAAAIIAP